MSVGRAGAKERGDDHAPVLFAVGTGDGGDMTARKQMRKWHIVALGVPKKIIPVEIEVEIEGQRGDFAVFNVQHGMSAGNFVRVTVQQ